MKRNVSVDVDIHEVADGADAFDLLTDHGETDEVLLKELPVGDLVFEDTIAFERKTLSDYITSLEEGRLERQADELRESYDHVAILGSFDMASTNQPPHSGILPTSVRGSMAKLWAVGVPVIPCSNERLLVDFAVRGARKVLEGSTIEYIPGSAVQDDTTVFRKQVGCLTNVGPQIADVICSEYANMTDLCHTTTENLMELDGIGEKRAKSIIAELRTTS